MSDVDDQEGTGAYRSLARHGAFAGLSVGSPAGPTWLPLMRTATPAWLADRSAGVGVRLAATSPIRPASSDATRIAVSVTQLGLVARLAAVTVACRAEGLPPPAPTDLLFVDELGGPVPLALLAAPSTTASWTEALVDLVRPVTEAAVALGLSDRVAWGNVASAVAGGAAVRPDLVAEALAHPALAGRGELGRTGFRRRSCCLIYRYGSGYCGDCVLARR